MPASDSSFCVGQNPRVRYSLIYPVVSIQIQAVRNRDIGDAAFCVTGRTAFLKDSTRRTGNVSRAHAHSAIDFLAGVKVTAILLHMELCFRRRVAD